MSEPELFPYQVEGVGFLRRRARAILGDAPGLGKTVQALRAILTRSAVIVAKLKTVAEWKRLAVRWRPDLPLIDGPPTAERPGVWIVHPAKLADAWTLKLDHDLTLVLDEIHEYRGLKSRMVHTIGSYTRVASHVWGLSGTPMYDRAAGMWAVFCIMGWAAHPSIRTRKRFDGLARCGSLFAVMRANGWILRRKIRGVEGEGEEVDSQLNLPPIRSEHVHLGPPPPGCLGGRTIGEVRAGLSPAKARAVAAWHADAEAAGRDFGPCLVFFTHRAGAAEAYALFGGDGVCGLITGDTPAREADSQIEAFQAGALAHMVLMTQCGGAGITLTRAHTVLRAETDWSPKAQEQARARAWRIGQDHECTEYVFGFDHWADDHVFALEAEKKREIAHNGF